MDVTKIISNLVSTIENIKDLIMPWYYSYLAYMTFCILFRKRMTFFISILHSLVKLKWYFTRILLI